MRIWGSEAAKTITNGIVVLIVVMKKYRPTRWTRNWFLSPEIIFSNDFWSVSRSARALGDQTANNCLRRSRGGVGEWADGNMTWTLHGASPVVSPKFESFKISTASRPRLSRSRNVANISFSTEPLRKRCLRHPLWWLVIISLFDQRWCPLISHEMQMKTMKTQFYASCLFHDPRKHCLRNWNSYQLPTTISHLLVSNKYHKNSPTMKSESVSTKNVTPGRKNRTCDSWGWCARWTLPPMGSTVMGTKIIKIVGKRLVTGWSSFELAIYHGF